MPQLSLQIPGQRRRTTVAVGLQTLLAVATDPPAKREGR